MNDVNHKPEPAFMFGVWGVMYGCDDRFGQGYNPHPLELEEVFELAAHVQGLDYLCGHYPGEFPADPERLIELARGYKIGIGGVVAKTFGAAFRNGGLSNPDPAIRAEAIAIARRCLECNDAIAPAMDELGFSKGCRHSVNWLGHDGSNGLFLCHYSERWQALVDSYVELLSGPWRCKIAIEPKPGDPAEDCFVRAAVHGLYLGHRIDAALAEERRGRFGLNLEYGHEHLAGGKLAEALCLALEAGRLFQIDLNDNRKRWDSDHIPGNDNEQEILEAEYWLYHGGFAGLWNFDLWPQRVARGERKESIRRFGDHLIECINGVRYRRELIKRLPPPEEMRALYLDPDETRVSRLLRETRNARIDFEEARWR